MKVKSAKRKYIRKAKACLEPGCITILHKNHIGDYCYLHGRNKDGMKLADAIKRKGAPSPYQKVLGKWISACADKNNCEKCQDEICEPMFDVVDSITEHQWQVKIKLAQIK